MKTKYIVTLATALLALASCVKDLETVPMNPWDPTADAVYGTNRVAYVQGLARLYFNFTTNDTTDLEVNDAGASELIRSFWSCQEVSTDEVKCAWGDAWAEAINTNKYSDANNDMTYAAFVRTLQGISYVNEYLRQTSPERLSARGVDAELKKDIEGFRAEARFLRAYFYWMALDLFGDVPFTDENDLVGETPDQISRKAAYEFVVSELEELAAEDSAMPEATSNRPRADKGSVLGLLARVYLNGEVYAGTDQVTLTGGETTTTWDLCRQTCEKIYDLNKYTLCSNYADMFRGDNGENPDAYNEFLFSAYYHNDYAQSWGGGTYLTCGAADAAEILVDNLDHIDKINIDTVAVKYNKKGAVSNYDEAKGDVIITKEETKGEWKFKVDSAVIKTDTLYQQISRLGIGNGWLGLHIHEHFVNLHFKPENVVWEGQKDEDGIVLEAGYDMDDVRGHVLHTARRKKGSFDKLENTFADGWGCWKYNNLPHNEDGWSFWKRTGSPDKSTDIDYPLIRLGEIHLIYAEACLRSGKNVALAQNKMNDLAARTGVPAITLPAGWSDEAMQLLREERGRELYWEGHRRTDLIRYNSYYQDTYLWPFKGGEKTGVAFEPYKVLYAYPSSQLKANPNWNNPTGY